MNKLFPGLVLFIGVCVCAAIARADTFPRYFFEAETLVQDRYTDKGYGMSRPELETGGWVTLQGTKMEKGALVRQTEPLPFTIPAGAIPPGQYKLSIRIARWVADKHLPALKTLRMVAGKTVYEYSFAATDGVLNPLGGVYFGEGRWQWITVPTPVEVGFGPLTIDLSVGGGTGDNYGILVDAVELTPDEATKTSSAAPESKWTGDVAGTFPIDPLPGVTHLSVLAGDPQSLNPVQAKMTIAPPGEKNDRFLCGWLRNELQLTQAKVRFSDGSTQSAEIPLVKLLHAQPIRLGFWYLLCLPIDDSRLSALDRTKPWEARLSATPLAEGVRLAMSDWLWMSREGLAAWSKEQPLSPDVRQELAVSSQLGELKSEAVSPDKKLLLWPTGTPDLSLLRDRIGSLKRAGVAGTVFNFNIEQRGKSHWIGTEIFSTPLAWSQLAPAMSDLASIDWSGLKDSLLRLNVSQSDSPSLGPGIDWFDDAAWKATQQNIGFCARLVHLAKVRGFMLDTETGSECFIFNYSHQKLAATKSFANYADEAFLRGKQFAEACQKECPGLMIMITHGTSELLPLTRPPFSPTNTNDSLLPAFVDGLLSVEGPEIVDGHESSYCWRAPREFLEGVWQMDESAEFSRNPALYRKKMVKGFAVWIDPWRKWDAKNENANYNSPETLENVLHWALRSSDHYVWLYAESVNWFRGMPAPAYQHEPSAAYDKALQDCRAPHDPRWLPPPPNINFGDRGSN